MAIQLKHKIYLALLIVCLTLSLYETSKLLIESRHDNRRLKQDLIATNSKITYYKSLSGHLVAKKDVLELKNKELKQAFPEILKELTNLKVQLNKVQSYTETVITHEKHITTVLHDSIVNDTTVARIFNYSDNFYRISGIATLDTQKVNIQSVDSLIQVVYRGKRLHPWLWFFSNRKLEQVITNKNPNSTIAYTRHIEISRKK